MSVERYRAPLNMTSYQKESNLKYSITVSSVRMLGEFLDPCLQEDHLYRFYQEISLLSFLTNGKSCT